MVTATSADNAILHMQEVSKIYRTETVETHALNGLSLSVNPGEFVAVTGPSGSGKTTFLAIAGLLESCTSGEYRLDGEEVGRMSDAQRAKIRNEKVGFVFQSFGLISDLNVLDNVELPLHYRKMSGAERQRRAKDALERVGLSSRARHLPAQLSGGQQQRVAIARALAGTPSLLLADEPTGNLDSSMASGVLDLLSELHADGATIVMVTHDLQLATRAQRTVRVLDGRAA